MDSQTMSEERMTKTMLEQLISENSDRIAFEVNEKGTSELWKLFYLVNVDGKRKEYACCSMCSSVVAHSQRTGTGSLLRHKCAQFVRETLQDKSKSGETGLKPDTVPKVVVEQLVGEHSNRITYEPNEKGTSHLWQIFKLVSVDGKREPYACCSMCGAVVVYSVKTGTGSLLRHKCSQFVVNTTPLKRKSAKKLEGSLSKVALCEKRQELLAFKSMKFVSKDLHPIKTVEGPGFRELAQALIDFGADFGKMPVEEVLGGVSEKFLAQTHIPRMYQDIRQRIAVIFCATDCIAFSTEMWNDACQKTCITLTAHLITEDFELHRLALGTRDVGETSSDGIRESILSIIAQYTGDVTSAEEKMRYSVFVTDTDPTIITAFQGSIVNRDAVEVKPLLTAGNVELLRTNIGNGHVACGCDALNLTLNEVFGEEIKGVFELGELCNNCHKLVIYFKKTGLNSKLSQSLKCEGRKKWNRVYGMIETIQDNFNDIKDLLCERDELDKLQAMDLSLLKELKCFLELFKQCYESLSANKRPTIQEFSLWNLKLKKHCDVNASDSQIMKQVKKLASQGLQLHFRAGTLHNVALLLNPSFKSLRVLPPEEKIHATAMVIELINAEERKMEKCDPLLPELNTTDNEPCVKRVRRDETAGEFDEFMDVCNENSTESSDELNRYMEKRVTPTLSTPEKVNCDKSKLDSQDDVLEFWRNHRSEFPNLSKIARHILAIPASATCNERVGSILEERRVHLPPGYRDEMLFLHYNL